MAAEFPRFQSILGIKFFVGDAKQAARRMQEGGLLVVPSGPGLKDLPYESAYREALLSADLVITDSAFMVLLWNHLHHDSIRRVSGLEYLAAMLKEPSFMADPDCFWIMPSAESASKNSEWLETQGIALKAGDSYIAPLYGKNIQDDRLLSVLRQRRPKHIFVALGGGTQEPLGHYLRKNLDYRPSIHCIGAAIAFLSGDQVHIPLWADHLYLGWLFRCLSNPKRYLPRYWEARKLLPLMVRNGASLPSVVS